MKSLALFLADADPKALQQLAAKSELQRPLTEKLVLLGVLLAVTSALFLSAYIAYRKRRRDGLSRSPHPPSFSQINSGSNPASAQSGHRRRKRRRRREHRPRNPTLSETGGLPPIRAEDQPPPPV